MAMTIYEGPNQAELLDAKIKALEARMEDWGAKWNATLVRMEKKQESLENDRDIELLSHILYSGYQSVEDLEEKFRICKRLLSQGDSSGTPPAQAPKKASGWIKLNALRPGALFETKNGTLAVKSKYRFADSETYKCFLLESGECAFFDDGNDTLVRELQII